MIASYSAYIPLSSAINGFINIFFTIKAVTIIDHLHSVLFAYYHTQMLHSLRQRGTLSSSVFHFAHRAQKRNTFCYRTENPFAFYGAPGGSIRKMKLTGTRNPSR